MHGIVWSRSWAWFLSSPGCIFTQFKMWIDSIWMSVHKFWVSIGDFSFHLSLLCRHVYNTSSAVTWEGALWNPWSDNHERDGLFSQSLIFGGETWSKLTKQPKYKLYKGTNDRNSFCAVWTKTPKPLRLLYLLSIRDTGLKTYQTRMLLVTWLSKSVFLFVCVIHLCLMRPRANKLNHTGFLIVTNKGLVYQSFSEVVCKWFRKPNGNKNSCQIYQPFSIIDFLPTHMRMPVSCKRLSIFTAQPVFSPAHKTP